MNAHQRRALARREARSKVRAFAWSVPLVAQVKVDGMGHAKWQFKMRVSTEMPADEYPMYIHHRAATIAREQKESGAWPKDGRVVVWYAQEHDLYGIVNEVDWHDLKGAP